MGNAQTQQNIGDFQEGVGKASASLGLISAYFGAFVMVGFSILFIYLAVTDQSFTSTSSNNKCVDDSDCLINDEKCQNSKCTAQAGPKEKHYWLLIIAGILIALAIFTVYYAKAVKDVADSSRGGAQFIGLGAEAQLARQAFNFKSGRGHKSSRHFRNNK